VVAELTAGALAAIDARVMIEKNADDLSGIGGARERRESIAYLCCDGESCCPDHWDLIYSVVSVF